MVFGLLGYLQLAAELLEVAILHLGQLIDEVLGCHDPVIGVTAHSLNLPFLAFIFL